MSLLLAHLTFLLFSINPFVATDHSETTSVRAARRGGGQSSANEMILTALKQ